ncbi:MAG: hypothetical protein NTZ67_07570 [Gammaproteobacteria bacterium]|nr:hypothetical protein [Gammaproteobacteria bacterium]
MSHVSFSKYGLTPFEKLMGHKPEILNKWNELESVFFHSNQFDAEFLEQIRRALAFNNLCQYCMAKAGPPDKNQNSVRLSEALRFANLFAINHTSINKDEITRMKKCFTDVELVELIAFCSFISASQKFGATFGLEPATNYEK